MKLRKVFLPFLCFFASVFAEELEFLAADGSGFNTKNVPQLIVTEYIKGQGKLIDNGSIKKQWAAYGRSEEVWQTAEFTIICGTLGVWFYDQENTRKIFFEPKNRPLKIHACQPIEGGKLLVAVNKVILELSPEGKIRKMIRVPYLKDGQRSQMKSVRKLNDGGYILSDCGHNKIYILDQAGMLTRTINLNKMDLPTKLKKIHGVELLENGNVLVSTGYGSSLLEINSQDEVVWSLEPDDLPSVGIKYLGGFSVLDNGNIIVAAYNSAFPMFEVSRDKKLIWKLKRDKENGIDLPTSLNQVSVNSP